VDDVVVWVVAGLVALGVEALTLTFVVSYFGLGAFAAAGAAALGAPVAGQLAVFAVVSLSLLLLTRRLVVGLVERPSLEAGSQHALIGRGAVVTIPLTGPDGTGQIRVGDEFWTARPADDVAVPIPVGTPVEVAEVTGVTARVRPRAAAVDAAPPVS
jgi:membrane protein implicated in regulation of membrane protease activity